MATLKLEIVTPDAVTYSEDVEMVTLPGAEGEIASTLRFLLSPRSAYVSGQMIHVGAAVASMPADLDWDRPLRDKLPLVTCASRGMSPILAANAAGVWTGPCAS